MKNIIFIAPPAAGKGTQSELLKEYYHIPHVSIGDLLRDQLHNDNEHGEEIRKIMELGNLVSDDIILKLLKERIIKNDCDNGYILDGYPRNIKQMEQYEDLMKSLNKEVGYVFFLDIDRKLATNRMLGRLNCETCGATYNEFFEEAQPKEMGICDTCHGSLSKREDDNLESFERRFDIYERLTKDLLEHFKDSNYLYVIDCTHNSKNNVFQKIKKILEGQND